MQEIYKIYALSSSQFPSYYRYIGYTKKLLNERLKSHKSRNIEISQHKLNWLNATGKNNIIITLLEDNLDSENLACIKEIQYIRMFKDLGYNLTNGTNGGKSFPKHKLPYTIKDKKNIFIFDSDKKLIEHYKSAKETSKKYNLRETTILALAAKNKYCPKVNLYFSYYKENINFIKKTNNYKLIHKESGEILTFNTSKDIKVYFNLKIKINNIIFSIKKGRILKEYSYENF